jgi:hypothetical protein
MQKKAVKVEIKKRGAKPLQRYDERIDAVNKKMKNFRITVAEFRREISPQIFSYNSLNIKLRKEIGLHESEIVAIEKAISKFEKSVIKNM